MIYYIQAVLLFCFLLMHLYQYKDIKKEGAIIALLWVTILSGSMYTSEIKDKIDSVCGATKVEETVDDSTLYPFPQD